MTTVSWRNHGAIAADKDMVRHYKSPVRGEILEMYYYHSGRRRAGRQNATHAAHQVEEHRWSLSRNHSLEVGRILKKIINARKLLIRMICLRIYMRPSGYGEMEDDLLTACGKKKQGKV